VLTTRSEATLPLLIAYSSQHGKSKVYWFEFSRGSRTRLLGRALIFSQSGAVRDRPRYQVRDGR